MISRSCKLPSTGTVRIKVLTVNKAVAGYGRRDRPSGRADDAFIGEIPSVLIRRSNGVQQVCRWIII